MANLSSITGTYSIADSQQASGSGELNLIENPDGDINLDGWVDSSTGTVSSRTTTAAEVPLFPLKDAAIKILVSSSPSTDYTYYRFTMPEALKNRVHKIQWEQLIGSTYLAGDFELELYYNSASDYSGGFTQVTLYHDAAIGAIEGQFYNEFLADQTYYELRIVQTTATAAATNWISLNNVIVGPGISASGALVTPWESYTPTTQGLGVISSNNLQWRRVGENVEIKGDLVIGTVSGDEAQIGLPNGYIVGMKTATGTVYVGRIYRAANASNVDYTVIATNGDSFLNFGLEDFAGNGTPAAPATGSNLFSSGNRISLFASVPVTKFAGTGTVNLLTPEVVESTVKFRATSNTAASQANNSVVIYEDVEYNDGNAYDSTTGIFTAPATGYYNVKASFALGSTTAGNVSIILQKNSSTSIIQTVADGTTVGRNVQIADDVYLLQGETLRVLVNTGGTNEILSTNSLVNHFAVTRIPDISAKSALGFGLATSNAAGLIPAYDTGVLDLIHQTDSVNITGYSSGNVVSGALHYTRIGNRVFVSIQDASITGYSHAPTSSADQSITFRTTGLPGIDNATTFQGTGVVFGNTSGQYRNGWVIANSGSDTHVTFIFPYFSAASQTITIFGFNFSYIYS